MPESLGRRPLLLGVPAALGGAAALSACSAAPDAETYEAVAARIRRPALPLVPEGAPPESTLGVERLRELVRFATLAPSSHNTQCWRFALAGEVLTILPDLLRRCPAVDPDDHHVFVSLGCATENLAHAALAQGLHAEARFDARRDVLRVTLTATPAQDSPLCQAIPARQCTRGDYDGQPLSSQALQLLERAGTSDSVRMHVLTGRQAMERNAFLNQPVEVAAMRPAFAAALDLPGQRPDLVVRFGHGATLPPSLRRPVASVMA